MLGKQVSEKIPLFLRTIQRKTAHLQVGDRVDLLDLFQRCSMSAVCHILFGDSSGSPLVPYVDPNGRKHMISLEESYMRVETDCDAAFKTVLNQLFPFLLDNHLGPLNRRNHNNRLAFDAALKQFLANSPQDDTIYGRLIREVNASEEDILDDLKGLMFAGFDSTSRACTGTMYRLLKHPHYLEKLREQLQDLAKKEKTLEESFKMHIKDLDFLSYVCKEGLRIDPPAQGSIGYQVKKECKIAGVTMKKGWEINVAIHAVHRDPRHWQKPDEFLPERFDEDSELYLTPEGKRRSPFAFLPFSYGSRSCAGQNMAKTEMSVFVAYMVLFLELELDLDDYMKDYSDIAFSLGTPNRLHVRLLKDQRT